MPGTLPKQHRGWWQQVQWMCRVACAGAYTSRAVVALMLQLMGPLVLISAFMALAPRTSPYSVTTSLSCKLEKQWSQVLRPSP